MKNILLFTLLYLFSSERSLAQYDFPDTGYVWRVINFNGFGNPAPKYDLHAEDYVDWKGKTYIRVDVYGDFGFERKNLLIYRYDSGRVYIKQNKFQYPLTDKDTNEFLLYDYNMNVGDSITYQKTIYGKLVFVVKSIDTMQYGGGRREFLLETGKSSDIIYRGQKWLEGIGNESGPFYTSFFEWESGARFHCLRLRAGTSVYPAYSPDCASRLYGVAVSEIAGADLKVFPQPSQGTLIIETIEKLTAIKVFDISGREMPVTVEMSHGQYFLDISRLAAATYILAAETMDGKLLRRVLLRGD